MISRRRIISRSLDQNDYTPNYLSNYEEEKTVWMNKEELFAVSFILGINDPG